MHLTRATGPIPDPFFEAVRRRHPDVDIVLLPPGEPPAEPAGPPVDDSAVAEESARVTRLANSIWRVAGALGPTPDATLAPGLLPGTVQTQVRVVRHDPDGLSLLIRLKDELVDRGWRVDLIPGAVERVVARGERASVSSSYSPEGGTFIFELSSVPLHVGRDRARTLLEVR